MRRLIIAIDGPSGAGKGTVARAIARTLDYRHIDSGAMYRAVAWKALDLSVPLDDERAVARIAESARIEVGGAVASNEDGGAVASNEDGGAVVSNEDGGAVVSIDDAGAVVSIDEVDVTRTIRTPEIDRAAAAVAKLPAVRRALVARQRALGEGGGIVMEGRDIGTVVFPHADVKIYLDATAEERARRRASDPAHSGGPAQVADVVTLLSERDHSDQTRAASPLYAAADAVMIDTTGKTIAEVVDAVMATVRQRVEIEN